MSPWSDNGRPPAPIGAKGRSLADAHSPGGRDGAGRDAGDRGGDASSRLPHALVACAVGGVIATSQMSLLAPVLVAYGLCLPADRDGRRALALGGAVALCVALALSAGAGGASMVSAAITSLTGLLVAVLARTGRSTPGAACLGVAAVAALHAGSDAAFAALSGTTLVDTMRGLIASYEQVLVETSAASAPQVHAAARMIGVFWPSAYVAVGFAEFACGRVGARMAAMSVRGDAHPARLDAFDLPLWMVATLVATAAALAAALTVPAVPSWVLVAVANVAMALRMAFAVQGLAVLVWVMRGKGLGSMAQVLLAALALYLEVQFVVLTVVGVVDVWANFRHLARGEAPDGGDTEAQDNEPAQAG